MNTETGHPSTLSKQSGSVVRGALFESHIMTNDHLYDLLFQFFSPQDMIRFALSSSQMRDALFDYMPRGFNINKLLLRFFPEPVAFRSLQARTGTCISGSTALQFFDRDFYPDSDLDLYVPFHYALEVGRFVENCGYAFVSRCPDTDEQWPCGQDEDFGIALNSALTLVQPFDDPTYPYSNLVGIMDVFTFTKVDPRETGKELKVQCIIVRCNPLETIVHFHSTVVMNLITYDKAYCLYPHGLVKRVALEIPDFCAQSRSHDTAILKYSRKGWRMVGYPWNEFQKAHHSFRAEERTLGDSLTWTIDLDTEGVDAGDSVSHASAPVQNFVSLSAEWRLFHEAGAFWIEFVKSYTAYWISKEGVDDSYCSCPYKRLLGIRHNSW